VLQSGKAIGLSWAKQFRFLEQFVYSAPIWDPHQIARLESALAAMGIGGEEIVGRYNQAVQYAVPWVSRCVQLSGRELLEIGCGSGSSTAAFAQAAAHVYAYDIESRLVNAAALRCQLLGISNVTAACILPTDFYDSVTKRHAHGIDMVLLYAVLEHCTIEERLSILRTTWNLLRPGGHLIVIETPNRFGYLDFHTTKLPFFHLLPPSLSLEFFGRSPRSEIVESVAAARREGDDAALLMLDRHGTGVSYHEFITALKEDDLARLVIADGFEDEMLDWFPINLEDRLLQTFFLEQNVAVPIGFSRRVLNLIFRKPDGASNDARRIHLHARKNLVTNYERNQTELARTQARLYEAFGRSKVTLLKLSPTSDVRVMNHLSLETSQEGLRMISQGDDPQLLLPPLSESSSGSIALVDISSPDDTVLQIFYKTDDGSSFNQNNSVFAFLTRGRNFVLLELPAGTVGNLRLDPGTIRGCFELHRLEIRHVQA
jgi:2-polyprenyl-3-methyl-5-hydroxy-6-metoxy-1,4-benzoquinol methylase